MALSAQVCDVESVNSTLPGGAPRSRLLNKSVKGVCGRSICPTDMKHAGAPNEHPSQLRCASSGRDGGNLVADRITSKTLRQWPMRCTEHDLSRWGPTCTLQSASSHQPSNQLNEPRRLGLRSLRRIAKAPFVSPQGDESAGEGQQHAEFVGLGKLRREP